MDNDAISMLNMNNINDKGYFGLWCWFLVSGNHLPCKPQLCKQDVIIQKSFWFSKVILTQLTSRAGTPGSLPGTIGAACYHAQKGWFDKIIVKHFKH